MLMKRIGIFIVWSLLLLFASSVQAQDDFNPPNPDEPQVPVFYSPSML